ncbi:MAG TPA: hypothetical protein VEH31_02050 [Streptosporangiaceae bacterium]|nr:hypothetical protein [Streptosporangiaceae bacterium]
MGEQANYRPPGWPPGSGPVSLEALEAAFGTARGSKPGDDDAHARPPEPGRPRPGTNPGPPWPAVVATTVRLWLRRRRDALGRLSRRRRVTALIVLAATALAASGLAVSFTRHAGIAPAAGDKAAQAGAMTGPAGRSAPAAAAAAWVARQVSRDAVVGCDPGMCRLLQAHGFPAGSLLALRPGTPGLRLCDVIVATRAVGKLLGPRLEGENAPAVIAGFGPGRARIDIRAIAPRGAAAYRAALAADWAARRKAAAQLMKSPRIHPAAAARQELLAGKVDSRLLITLAALAVSYPVNVMAFGDDAPGSAAAMPLREMEIAGAGSPAGRAAELQHIRSSVLAQHSVFLPAHVSLVRLAGGAVLRIEFGAPSPLGLLLGRPVTQ